MKRISANYARVSNGQVTHTVSTYKGWTELNNWSHIPGEWVECDQSVAIGYSYDATTGTFQPPVPK